MDKVARPLADAAVTILDGPLAGTTTRTYGGREIRAQRPLGWQDNPSRQP